MVEFQIMNFIIVVRHIAYHREYSNIDGLCSDIFYVVIKVRLPSVLLNSHLVIHLKAEGVDIKVIYVVH